MESITCSRISQVGLQGGANWDNATNGFPSRMYKETRTVSLIVLLGASSATTFNESNASMPIISIAMLGTHFELYIVQSAAASISYWMVNPTGFAIDVVAA
jgi:hypothetical protein